MRTTGRWNKNTNKRFIIQFKKQTKITVERKMRIRNQTWTLGLCESCLKNAHEKVKVIREIVYSTDSNSAEEMFVCPQCGATKRL